MSRVCLSPPSTLKAVLPLDLSSTCFEDSSLNLKHHLYLAALFKLEICIITVYIGSMAAERFSNDVLQTFYEPVMPEKAIVEQAVVKEEPGVNEYKITRTDSHEWVHVCKMDAPKKIIFRFPERNETKLVDVVEREMQSLNLHFRCK